MVQIFRYRDVQKENSSVLLFQFFEVQWLQMKVSFGIFLRTKKGYYFDPALQSRIADWWFSARESPVGSFLSVVYRHKDYSRRDRLHLESHWNTDQHISWNLFVIISGSSIFEIVRINHQTFLKKTFLIAKKRYSTLVRDGLLHNFAGESWKYWIFVWELIEKLGRH